jgi:hypothetical protein
MAMSTPSGQLAEVHSMQPSDANSQAAVDYVKTMPFSNASTPVGALDQHFEFFLVKFVTPPPK